MKPIGTHNYYVYITTNPLKTVIYTGVTNDLARRMAEHFLDSITEKKPSQENTIVTNSSIMNTLNI